MDTPRLFRSYGPFGVDDYPNLPIWQAARATSAAPRFFKRMRIGEKNQEEEFVDGGMGANNPTKLLLKEVLRTYETTRRISCIVSVGCGEASIIDVKDPGFLQKILPTDLIDALKNLVTDCRQTAQEMEEKFQNLPNVYFRFNVDQGLQDTGLEEWKEVGAIKSRTITYLGRVNRIVSLAVRALAAPEAASQCTVANLSM